jgi:hypothetical protein
MPRGLRTLHLSFTETRLTHFGGMILLQRFCSQIDGCFNITSKFISAMPIFFAGT